MTGIVLVLESWPQKSGKFRRTALTFLGVRKTICILPSFFVGRSKSLSKWSSKKAIFKSKTHDGLSKACQEDNLRSGYASAGDCMYHSHRDVAGNVHSKSLSLTRHKRGFRSLFQSIKQHRNNRNAVEKGEMFTLSSAESETDTPVVVQDYTEQYLPECLESEPDVPDFDQPIGAECVNVEVIKKCTLIQDISKSGFDHEISDNQTDKINLVALVSSDYEGLSRVQSDPCLKLEMVPQSKLKSEATTGSSDQLNVMFEDVDSLKSFDSLTGCGDIIADQEDDSLTESTRTSCYLTYQGGGEEMACPEDLDEECLENMWVNDASEEMCCPCNQDQTDLSSDMTCSHNMDLRNSNSTQKAVDSSIADVMTPQSEHQESAPNSDEGYYDATTPGPEDGQEKSHRLRPDRLPRDSYSGDALYELFAPDESLISPHHEKKSLLLGSECEYVNKPVDLTESAFLPDINQLQHLKRHSGISFGSASDPDFEAFCEPKELLEENKPVALPYKTINTRSTEISGEMDDEQAVCFSQALEDYTKHTQMMSTLHNSVAGLETSPAFIPNMEALPAIVTFDVVDMHNEGEYDDQMQMDFEEDLSTPYQEFEESYLQKDAFAECDYHMLDPYEQNILSNTWAIASLPRHLGLTRVSQVLPAPLSQDRRSRSLDTEDLDLNMSDKYEDYRGALISCFAAEKESRSSYSKKSRHVPLKDGNITLPWQTKSEMDLSISPTDMDITGVRGGNQSKTSVTPSTDFQNPKSLHLSSSTSNSASSELFSSPELFNRQCHLPLLRDSCLPHSPFYYNEIMADSSPLNDAEKNLFGDTAVNMLCKGSMKTKPVTREGISPCSPTPVLSINDTKLD
uniref:APC membrane recruitment protein 1 n=1 Tax=Neogobius melanostomus TaxID=47308 RepID=A0A8C6TEV3_9GOBI